MKQLATLADIEQIRQRILALPLDGALTVELADSSLLQQHSLYLQLPEWLAPLFTGISSNQLAELRLYSYLYFRFLLKVDGLLDAPDGATTGPAKQMLGALSLHELSVRGLTNLFPGADPFWEAFAACKQEYVAANMREKKFAEQPESFTEAGYEAMAAGKSAVCYALVPALASLGRVASSPGALCRCLQHLHIGMQYHDDLEDFRQDWEQGQYTYARFLLEKHSSYTASSDVRKLHQQLYTSGVAQQLLRSGCRHYELALTLAQELGLPELAQHIRRQVEASEAHQHDIAELLQKTVVKACKSMQLPQAAAVDALSLLRATQMKAAAYLQRSQDEAGGWTDFMTSAGPARQWVTAYAGWQLAQTDLGLLQAQQASQALQALPSAYNESLMQDGDSTSFVMGLRRQLGLPAEPSALAAWLSFMNDDGGWVTYRNGEELRQRLKLPAGHDVTGWLAPQACVTAAAASILRQFSELAPQYEASCAWLLQRQEAGGHWPSYWWSSPIYATAFALEALAGHAADLPACTAAVAWLLAQQTAEGCWLDATSRQPSAFYTALALKALLSYDSPELTRPVEQGIAWLIRQQTADGSWLSGRSLRIPATGVLDPATVRQWRPSSFGVNALVDDHNRVFTTSTVLGSLGMFAKATIVTS